MRNYLEEVGYDLESYVSELLRSIKDDLFDTVGIEEENIDATVKQIIEAANQTVCNENELEAEEDAITIPEPYNEYYRIMTDEEVEEYGLEDEMINCKIDNSYDLEFVGFAIAKDDCMEALADNGLEIVNIDKTSDGSIKLMQSVADRLFDVEVEEVEKCCRFLL